MSSSEGENAIRVMAGGCKDGPGIEASLHLAGHSLQLFVCEYLGAHYSL